MNLSTQTAAQRWMQKGIAENIQTRNSFEKTKAHALTTGYYFIKAQESCTGDFKDLCANYKTEIGERTIQRAMEMTRLVLEHVVKANPKLKHDVEAQLKAAFQMTLESPKPLIAFLRALKKSNATGNPATDFQIMPFGLYDGVKYRDSKVGTVGQIEFNFADLATSVEQLTHFGDQNYTFKFPEGVDEAEYISTVELKLEAALSTIRRIKKNQTVDV